MKYSISFFCLAALIAGLLACASTADREDTAGLHPKLSDTAYIEKGDLLTMIVDTGIAYGRPDQEIFALEIGIANLGMESLTLTRESFTLVDGTGRQYAPIQKSELTEMNYNRRTDLRLARLLPILQARWLSYSPLRSNFSPGFAFPFEREEVYLNRYTWIYDTLYFPNQFESVRGKRFALLLSAPELYGDIVLNFRVPGS